MRVIPARAVSSSGHKRDIRIEECKAVGSVSPESLARALALLASWALRRARVSPGGSGRRGENRVTADTVKGYGAQNGDN